MLEMINVLLRIGKRNKIRKHLNKTEVQDRIQNGV